MGGSRRGTEESFGRGRPVEPEEAWAHGDDPGAVRINREGGREGGQGGTRKGEGQGFGEGEERRATSDGKRKGQRAPNPGRWGRTTSPAGLGLWGPKTR